jgi:endoglucanase
MKTAPIVSLLLCFQVASFATACSKGSNERVAPSFDATSVSNDVPPEEIQDNKPFAETPVGQHGRLRVEGTDLVDKDGHPVQLKGISSMWLNMETSGFATSGASMKWMRDNWNISLFRAAMGVGDDQGNPSGGGYLVNPERMTNYVDRIVENATKLGLYVIIDWHDHVAEDHLDEAQAFFGEMAERYKGNENVFYEVFNEPVPGIRDRVNFEVKRAFTWDGDIKPYHEKVLQTIRAHDPQGVVILGTPTWSQEVDLAAANPVAGSNLMYTLHYYSCTHTGWLRDRAQAARDQGLPIFVTEWGATDASGGTSNPEVCSDESDLWQDWMNTNHISWAAWKLDDCSDTSCLLNSGTRPGSDWSGSLHGHGAHVVEKLKADTAPDTETVPSDASSTEPAPSTDSAEPAPSEAGSSEAGSSEAGPSEEAGGDAGASLATEPAEADASSAQ